MKKMFVLALVAISVLALGSAACAFTWTEDFESYADQAEFEASWSPMSTSFGQVSLSTAQAKSGTQSAYQPALAKGSWKAFGAEIPTTSLYFGFWFYLPAAANSRTFCTIQAKTGATYDGGLVQLLAIGNYNTAYTTKYWGRVAVGAGSGWFTLDAGPDRTVGWHYAEIVGKPDGTVDWKIDGIVGATKTVADANFNLVGLGSGISTDYDMYFDDITVAAVPEPSSMLALASGLIGMAGFVVRRRK